MKSISYPEIMIINDELLDKVTAEAEASPRLRMNYNLHESLDAKVQRLINVLLPGTPLPMKRHTSSCAAKCSWYFTTTLVYKSSVICSTRRMETTACRYPKASGTLLKSLSRQPFSKSRTVHIRLSNPKISYIKSKFL